MPSRGSRILVVRCAQVLAALVLVGTALGLPQAQKPVAAKLIDFKIKLSRPTVAPGKVTFNVSNNGAVPHNLVFVGAGGKRTRILEPRHRQTITVDFKKPGVYRFYCSVSGHRALGMQGTIRVGAGTTPPATTPGSTPTIRTDDLQLTRVASGLGPITSAVSPPGDTDRLLVAQQNGIVSLLVDGVLQPKPFLDLRDRVRADGEKGLLSIAFAPDFQTSGLLYADYNDLFGNLRVVEFHRSPGNPNTADPGGRELLHIIKPTADHNGGMLQFGPDGDLYVAVGDGGANPPVIPVGAYGQTLDDLLGDILRIDPRHGDPYAIPPGNPLATTPGARPEIVAYGLRNPWRFWIDATTNRMLIGDVGEGEQEEIDELPLDQLGLDFGWPCREGRTVPPDVTEPAGCATALLTPPIYAYAHSSTRCSITGGVVARDPRLPQLNGLFLWSDLCDGQLYAVDPQADPTRPIPLTLTAPDPTTFGVDAGQRVYVGTADGTLYRLDPR